MDFPVKKIAILALLLVLVSSDTIVQLTSNSQSIAATADSIPKSNNTSSTPQKIAVKLQRQPMYAYPGILIDFLITPSIERSQDDIESLFQYQFSDNKYLPPRMHVSVGEKNQQIRVMFDYHNDIPFKPFTVKFKVADQRRPGLGSASITLVFDSISGGISNALGGGKDHEDFIR